jgi:hypothetical protein
MLRDWNAVSGLQHGRASAHAGGLAIDDRSQRTALMSDEPFYSPNLKPLPPRQPKPGEPLFTFVRALDRAPMSCELRFHGESYGWEAQILERGELLSAHGAFTTRAAAIQWAESEREAITSS